MLPHLPHPGQSDSSALLQEREISIPFSQCGGSNPQENKGDAQLVPLHNPSCGSEERISGFSFEGFSPGDRVGIRPQLFPGGSSSTSKPLIDLFASQVKHKLPCYVTLYLHKGSVATDAMSLDWNRWDRVYLFPLGTCC